MKLFFKLCLIGILSGVFLGGVLKLIQQETGEKVYTLLLNVDYLPVVKTWDMSEGTEFLLHLIVSVGLVMVLYVFKITKVIQYVWVCALIGVLLFFTTAFSDRTPELTDINAFLYWITTHGLYGVMIGFLMKGRLK